jgi:hypothetical protein
VGGLYALQRYSAYMDVYEKGILLGRHAQRDLAGLVLAPAAHPDAGGGGLALMAIGLYQQDGAGSLARAETVFGLKYFPVQPVGHPVDEHAVLHEHGVLLDRHVLARRGHTMS